MRFLAVLAVLVALSPAAAQEDVVAEVGTRTITRAELSAFAQRDGGKYAALLLAAPDDVAALHSALAAELDALVEERILLLEADRRGVDELDELPDPVLRARRRIALLLRAAVDMADVSITRDDAARYYDAHADEFELPARTSVYLLATTDRAKADRVKAKLAKARDAWPEIAEAEGLERRVIPDAQLESELGPRARDVAKLRPGSAAVLLTNTGYALVALVERLPARTVSLDEAEPAIEERLRETPHRAKLP